MRRGCVAGKKAPMIAHVSIDVDGGVTVSCDSDGDQGDAYSSEVLGDIVSRAARTAVTAWCDLHRPEDTGE